MSKLQKFLLHPLTAFLFAAGAYRFVDHYQLFNFMHAAVLCFIVAFLSYMFLSLKYDPSMSIIFFIMAVFVGYRAMVIPDRPLKPAAGQQENINRLIAVASAVRYYEIIHGELPANLSQLSPILESARDVSYCQGQTCSANEFLGTSGRSGLKFAIISRLVDPQVWYVDESLQVFPKKE